MSFPLARFRSVVRFSFNALRAPFDAVVLHLFLTPRLAIDVRVSLVRTVRERCDKQFDGLHYGQRKRQRIVRKHDIALRNRVSVGDLRRLGLRRRSVGWRLDLVYV